MTRFLVSYAEGQFRIGCYIDGADRTEALEAFDRRSRYMQLRFDHRTLKITEEPRR